MSDDSFSEITESSRICSICTEDIDDLHDFSIINHLGETGIPYHEICLRKWFEVNNHGIVTREKIKEFLTYSNDHKLKSVTYIQQNGLITHKVSKVFDQSAINYGIEANRQLVTQADLNVIRHDSAMEKIRSGRKRFIIGSILYFIGIIGTILGIGFGTGWDAPDTSRNCGVISGVGVGFYVIILGVYFESRRRSVDALNDSNV